MPMFPAVMAPLFSMRISPSPEYQATRPWPSASMAAALTIVPPLVFETAMPRWMPSTPAMILPPVVVIRVSPLPSFPT